MVIFIATGHMVVIDDAVPVEDNIGDDNPLAFLPQLLYAPTSYCVNSIGIIPEL